MYNTFMGILEASVLHIWLGNGTVGDERSFCVGDMKSGSGMGNRIPKKIATQCRPPSSSVIPRQR